LYLVNSRSPPAAGMDVDHKLKPFNCEEDLDHIYGRILKLPEK